MKNEIHRDGHRYRIEYCKQTEGDEIRLVYRARRKLRWLPIWIDLFLHDVRFQPFIKRFEFETIEEAKEAIDYNMRSDDRKNRTSWKTAPINV